MKSSLLLFVSFVFFFGFAFGNDLNNITSIWDRVVRKYVVPNQVLEGITVNVVDYNALHSNNSDLLDVLDKISNFNYTNLQRDELYTFFINVYNVFAVNMILTNPCKTDLFGQCSPIHSIRDIGSLVPYEAVWDKPAGTIGGKVWTLQQIEDYLRSPGNYKEDPRLHAAIVCASISCPNLRNEAYTLERLDFQLTDNFNNFLNNTKKGMFVNQAQNLVTLSSIFDWFSDDFIKNVNASNPTVISFIVQYLSPSHPDYNFLKANPNVPINFFDYDWDVNGANGGAVPCSNSRPCYTLLYLLITLAVILLVATVVLIVYCCIRRRRRKGYYSIQQ